MIIMNQRNFAKRSLKESKNDDIKNYIDDLRTYSKKDVPSYSKSYYFWSYYEFNISDNEWTKVSLSGRDYTKSLKDANNFAKSDDVVKAYLVFKNPNNPNENFKVIIKENDFYESKKSTRKSIKESKVDFQSVIDKVLPKEYAKNKNAYRYALSCVTSLYNEDEYDSDSAKVYFLNCYISDLFPSWVDELGEEEIDTFANALYDGTMKWSDIDSSWFESKKSARKSLKENELFSSNTPYEIKINGKKIKSHSDYEVVYDRVENDEYVLGIKIKGVGNAQLRFSSKNEAKELGWIINESKKSTRKSLKEYLVKGLDVDFVVDHLLSLEDPDNFDLINELDDLWELYKKSWNKFNKSLSDFWKVMKDIEKLDSFNKTCKEIVDAWYDDIKKIFYSDDSFENLKLNYGFEGYDLF